MAGAAVAGAVVALLATFVAVDGLDLVYRLLGEPLGAVFTPQPTERGMVIGATTGAIGTFLAYLAGGYVAGRIAGAPAGFVAGVFGLVLASLLATGPLVSVQQRGAVLAAAVETLLVLLGDYLGGRLGARSGPATTRMA